jgi:hypothetical protein
MLITASDQITLAHQVLQPGESSLPIVIAQSFSYSRQQRDCSTTRRLIAIQVFQFRGFPWASQAMAVCNRFEPISSRFASVINSKYFFLLV